MACSLCQGPVNSATGRVEVRGFQINDEDRKMLMVNWNDDGDALFHRECWANLVIAAKVKGEENYLTELEVSLINEAKKTAEYHDPHLYVMHEARRIVHMLRQSEYPVLFTGAGISTAAGIGDYRGKDGKWTDQDRHREHGERCQKNFFKRPSIRDLRPTYTHEAIMKLVELGLIKYIISQNVDGLHRLSGVPDTKISELHGNAFIEKCEGCGTRYDMTRGNWDDPEQQTRHVPQKKCRRCRMNHRTGRLCQLKNCNGYLMNTIINFGDFLEDPILNSATENAKRADLFVCLGSTLSVTPANALVSMGLKPNRLIICNRQPTEYDRDCTRLDENGFQIGCRVFEDCDILMAAVMREVLDEQTLRDWEEGRELRMKEYDRIRGENNFQCSCVI